MRDLERRLVELARLGFRRVVIPKANRYKVPSRLSELELLEFGTVKEALAAVLPRSRGNEEDIGPLEAQATGDFRAGWPSHADGPEAEGGEDEV